MHRSRPWWTWWMLICAATAAWAGEPAEAWIRGTYTGGSPRPIATQATNAWRQASHLAERTDRAFVLVGGGDSMRPLYAPGTILVLRQIPYARLQRGQTALYRNRQGKVVAHVLVTRARDGWRARGLNNRRHDMEPVRAENFIGVVIAAYQPTDRPPGLRLAGMR